APAPGRASARRGARSPGSCPAGGLPAAGRSGSCRRRWAPPAAAARSRAGRGSPRAGPGGKPGSRDASGPRRDRARPRLGSYAARRAGEDRFGYPVYVRRGLATLLLAGAAALAGAEDAPTFAGNLPTAVGDVSRWQVVTGSFETESARGSYLFYVNPARSGLYQLMRYKV